MRGALIQGGLFLLICGCQIQHSTASVTKGAISEEPPLHDDAYYFWNEVTGETQWEDPGGVAFEDANAQRYWKSDDGTPLLHDPKANLYSWLETWSSEHSRPYYYHQKTKKSQWEKPEDLAWRRVKAVPTDGSQTDDSLINVSGELQYPQSPWVTMQKRDGDILNTCTFSNGR